MNFVSRPALLSSLRLTSAFLLGLTSAPVQAQSPSLATSSHNYSYLISFTTPSPFITVGAGNVMFSFNPEVVGGTPASATASNLTYSPGWQAGFPSTFGDASINYSNLSATAKNTDAANGFNVPIYTFGSDFSFNLAYADPPGPTATDFSVTLQASGLKDQSLFDLQFNPSGNVVLLGTTDGVTITPQNGTPPIVPAAVPEASTSVSLGLLLALSGAVVLFKRKKAPAST